MGKIVKTVLKIAAVAAIAVFAPPVAAAIAGSVGVSGAIGTTLIAAGVGAGAGELAGVGWKAGLMAGGLSGANSSGLFGGAPPTGGAGAAAPAAGGAAGAPVDLVPTAMGGTAQYGAAAAAPTAVAAAPATLGSTLSSFASNPLGTLGGGVKSMTTGLGGALGGLSSATGLNLGVVAPNLLAAGLVGNPGGAMAKAQEAELARAQQVNAALTQQRLDEANKLIGEAAYYDPEYMARQSAEAAMIKGGIQTAEATRGLTGERLAAERRRMRLGTARNAGTAYQQGYGTGVGARTQVRQAGISAIPTEYPMTNPSSAMAADEYARATKANEAKKLGDIFSSVLYGNPATQLGA